jgi:hypothetical protein
MTRLVGYRVLTDSMGGARSLSPEITMATSNELSSGTMLAPRWGE